MFQWLTKKVEEWSRPSSVEAARLYRVATTAARHPGIYGRYGVADTLDGRFDAVTLAVSLLARRLVRSGDAGRALAQELVDTMFADMDLSLHEIGVSENKVGKKVKIMARAFVGRMKAYGEALDGSDAKALAAALERNLYRANGAPADAMARQVLAAARRLDGIPDEALLEGKAEFVLVGYDSREKKAKEQAKTGKRG